MKTKGNENVEEKERKERNVRLVVFRFVQEEWDDFSINFLPSVCPQKIIFCWFFRFFLGFVNIYTRFLSEENEHIYSVKVCCKKRTSEIVWQKKIEKIVLKSFGGAKELLFLLNVLISKNKWNLQKILPCQLAFSRKRLNCIWF